MESKEARVVILTVNEQAGQCYREDLNQVIPEDRIEILTYTPGTFQGGKNLKMVNAYLVSKNAISYYDEEKLADLPLGVQIVDTQVAFQNRELNRVRQIKKGTECLLVNGTEPLAMECIAEFHGHSIFNVHFTPYWSGAPLPKGIDTAVSSGEEESVPPQIKTAYHLGNRHLTPDTVMSVLLATGMDDLVESPEFRRYADRFPKRGQSSDKLLKKTMQNQYISEYLMDASESGIVGINEEGRIFCNNKKALELLGCQDKKLNGIQYEEILPFLRLEKIVESDDEDVCQYVFRQGSTSINATVRKISDGGVFKGAFAWLQRVSDEEDRVQNMRLKMYKKDYVAKYTFDDIIGRSASITELCKIAKKMAATDSTILISGESGTGKELLASAIHNASRRENYPYIAINCAAIPENLLESELFGYEEGAFTGSRKHGKAGLFEVAHRGTLFLDEVENMSPALQIRLLRVLQEKEIMRVGGSKIIPVDVRIIAATNENLEKMVKEGLIRKDLYYRLNALQLELTPLRKRKEDIPLLIEEFQKQMGIGYRIADEVLRRFMEHKWDGNIRELRNYIEYFACLEKDVIQPDDIPIHFYSQDALASEDAERNDATGERNEARELSEEERFALLVLHDAFSLRRPMGRRTLCDAAAEKNILLTEKEARNLLKQLEERGLVRIGSGRAGSRLTRKGVELAGQMREQGGK